MLQNKLKLSIMPQSFEFVSNKCNLEPGSVYEMDNIFS